MAKYHIQHDFLHKKHKGKENRERLESERLERRIQKSKIAYVIAWLSTWVIILAVLGGVCYGIYYLIALLLN